MQLLAARGYVVVYPNPRQHHVRPGIRQHHPVQVSGDDYKDLMSRWIRDRRGYVDSTNWV